MWLADSRSGVTGPVGSNFEEWFAVLLDPRLVLMKEKEAAEAHEGVRYSVRDEGDEVLLTVRAKARGDFRNDYLFNGSIDESDTRREYRFDSATNLLKGLKVYVLDGRREVLVLEVAAVGYNVLVDEKVVVSLPEGYVAGCRWTVCCGYVSVRFGGGDRCSAVSGIPRPPARCGGRYVGRSL